MTFDRSRARGAPTTEGGGESPPPRVPPPRVPPPLRPRVFPGLEAFENRPRWSSRRTPSAATRPRAPRVVGELLIAARRPVATVHDSTIAESTCPPMLLEPRGRDRRLPSCAVRGPRTARARARAGRDARLRVPPWSSRARAGPGARGARAASACSCAHSSRASCSPPRECARHRRPPRVPSRRRSVARPPLMGMARAVNGLLPPENRVEPVEALAAFVDKTRANLHGVADAEGRNLGSGLFLEASVFNHACAPEAVASFDSRTRTMAIRAVRRVEEGGTADRVRGDVRAEARTAPGADEEEGASRAAPRCEADDASEAALHGFRCDDPKCEGVVTRASPGLDPSKCSSCGRARSPVRVRRGGGRVRRLGSVGRRVRARGARGGGRRVRPSSRRHHARSVALGAQRSPRGAPRAEARASGRVDARRAVGGRRGARGGRRERVGGGVRGGHPGFAKAGGARGGAGARRAGARRGARVRRGGGVFGGELRRGARRDAEAESASGEREA